MLKLKYFPVLLVIAMLFIGSGCKMDYRSKDDYNGSSPTETKKDLSAIQFLSSSDIEIITELRYDKDDFNIIVASGELRDYSNYKFTKTGNSYSSSANLYGSNSALLARGEGMLNVWSSIIISSGDNANAVFAFGKNTSATVSDCVILTQGDHSAGIVAAAEAEVTAKHITVETKGTNSSPIRAERKGIVNAVRGSYTSFASSSPVVYSASDVTVSNARLESKYSQSVILEGLNSVTLISCDITANHHSAASSDSDNFQAVLIHQKNSPSPVGTIATLTVNDSKLTNTKGDVFSVTNNKADITVINTDITNKDLTGFLLDVTSSDVNFRISDQAYDSDITLDNNSRLNFYMSNVVFDGAVNANNYLAEIHVDVSDSYWNLADDSYISSLTCESDCIRLNGHNLFVDGAAYVEGTVMEGSPIEF